MSLPLAGIRVLDLSRLLPGGFCSLLLADLGAEVLKVEDTGMGDYIRLSPPYVEGAADSAKSSLFLALNRNKRSIRIDLKHERGREALRRARVLPARGPGSPRRRLRAHARGQPRDRLLRDLRLRADRA
jgi:crotonobetainyl-CoA:carnitine CoA-transferase CaiB-like acyl-CoA transferase